jgi:hypothetical protein
MANIEIFGDHIIHQLKIRYPNAEHDKVLNRVTESLRHGSSEEWCFTESPAARFFIVDYESGIKLLV